MWQDCMFSWLIHVCDMTHSYEWHDSFICVTWLIPMWHDGMCAQHRHSCMRDMTHSYAWHDSFTQYLRSPKALLKISYMWHDSFMCVMTHSYVWHDSLVCVVWFVHPVHTAFSLAKSTHDSIDSMSLDDSRYVASFIHETWLIHMCDVTHSWHELYIRINHGFDPGHDRFHVSR